MQAKSVGEALGKMFKFSLLARRDGIHTDLTDQYGDEYEDPYFRYETLDQLNNPKSSDDDPSYYTYEYDELVIVKDKNKKSVKIKDPETGKMVVKKEVDSGPHKVKNFVTIGGDLKLFLLFIFNKYMEESYQCFIDNNKEFNEPGQVLSQVRGFVENTYGMPNIGNFIGDIVDLIPVDEFIDDDEIPKINKTDSLDEYLIKQAKITFKDDKGSSPNRQLKKIIDKFINFLQLNAIMYMEQIWGTNPGTLHVKDILGVLRPLYATLRSEGHEFQYGVYSSAEQWVADSIENAKTLREENAKKKAAEDKKPAAKKGAKKAPAKKKGKSSKKKKEETPPPSDDEENNSEVDDALDDVADEDPSQEAVSYESEQEFDDSE